MPARRQWLLKRSHDHGSTGLPTEIGQDATQGRLEAYVPYLRLSVQHALLLTQLLQRVELAPELRLLDDVVKLSLRSSSVAG